MTLPNPDSVPQKVQDLSQQLSQPRPLRRGSLSVRYMKCSKKGCACAEDPEARHGPYHTLTRTVKGKTRSRYLSPEKAGQAARQIEAGQQFRQQVEAYWQACERWADRLLDPSEAGSEEAAEKKGSKSRSKRRPRPKSRRS